MPEQSENQEATKLESETLSDASAEKRIEQIAEKAAKRPGKTEERYDSNHPIFSK